MKLRDGVVADYESQTSYSVTVISTDSGGLSVSKDFVISINDVNEPVTFISLGLSNQATVDEGIVGGFVGSLDIDDPDLGEVRTYLITGQDAKYFEIKDGDLQVKSGISLDYENLSFTDTDSEGNLIKVLYLTVTVIDSGGYTAKNTFQIQVLDLNDSPYDIKLTGTMISASNYSGSVVGLLESYDQDQNEQFTYTLDNSNFEIVDGYLRVKNNATFSNESGDTLPVVVTVTDSANNSYTETFTLTFGELTMIQAVLRKTLKMPMLVLFLWEKSQTLAGLFH